MLFDESKKTGNKVPVSVTASTVVLVSLILEKFVVTTEGSAVVASLGDEVALVEWAPACNLVSDTVPNEPPEDITSNTTPGLIEYW